MAGGDSAAFQAERFRLTAEEHERLAAIAREMHRRYSAAAFSERRVAQTLEVLAHRGYTILADRRWPGSRTAQVDFVAIGPGGVFIVDAKHWGDLTIAGGLILRGQADVTEDFENLADLADHTRSSLAGLGLAAGEVHAFAVFTNQRALKPYSHYRVTLVSERHLVTEICRAPERLTPPQVDQVLLAVDELFPSYALPTSAAVNASVPEPVLPAESASITLAPVVAEPPLTEQDILDALIEGVLAQPIEAWMSFLHPTQANLVARSFSGPSRVRGAAGTGKTVVALHRAAHLARSGQGRVLVTTFVRTLPAVMQSLLERLAPDIVDRVEFRGVHQFALDVARRRGLQVDLQVDRAERIFETVWGASAVRGIEPSKRYWREEIDSVIRGRGLTSFEDYATLARAGRRRRLTVDQRRVVWDLHVAYDRALSAAGIDDFVTVIAKVEASLRARPLEGFSGVIVDEAQDLSCLQLRMLHALVGDRPDGLHLVGDGQQSIYPGGFTLSEAGISIAGRATVLSTNYRNTAEIVEFAAELVAGDDFVDIEGGSAVADSAAPIPRHGSAPSIARFATRGAHDVALSAALRDARHGSTGWGDIAVLTMSNAASREIAASLSRAGIPSLSLFDYQGEPIDAVKVGTVHRAKGLEFKHVFVARVDARLLGDVASDPESSERERRELDRRALYVAMTRARDALWVGVAA
jgi:hypothetical protein